MSDTTDKAPDRATTFLRDILAHYQAYHHHKELMAYSAFALYAGVIGAILIADNWPPKWFLTSYAYRDWWALVPLFFLFALSMLFVGWQLRNRRLAALRVSGTQRVLAVWIRTPPTDRDLRVWKPSSTIHRRSLLLALVWPPCTPTPTADLPYEAYPAALARYWYVQEKGRGTGATWHEHLISFAMWALFLVACARTVCPAA